MPIMSIVEPTTQVFRINYEYANVYLPTSQVLFIFLHYYYYNDIYTESQRRYQCHRITVAGCIVEIYVCMIEGSKFSASKWFT